MQVPPSGSIPCTVSSPSLDPLCEFPVKPVSLIIRLIIATISPRAKLSITRQERRTHTLHIVLYGQTLVIWFARRVAPGENQKKKNQKAAAEATASGSRAEPPNHITAEKAESSRIPFSYDPQRVMGPQFQHCVAATLRNRNPFHTTFCQRARKTKSCRKSVIMMASTLPP